MSVPEELLAEIDRVAKETGRTRSGLIQYVTRLYLIDRSTRPPRDRPGVMPALERAQEAGRALPSDIDWTAEIRRLRDSR